MRMTLIVPVVGGRPLYGDRSMQEEIGWGKYEPLEECGIEKGIYFLNKATKYGSSSLTKAKELLREKIESYGGKMSKFSDCN